MKEYKLKDLRQMVENGAARRISATAEIPGHFDKVGYAKGVYGLIGGLIQDNEGNLFAALGRTSILFSIF